MFDELNKDQLITKFAEGCIAALHIDLEEQFIFETTRLRRCSIGLIPLINSFSKPLREQNIDNYWAAGGLNNRLMTYSEFRATKRKGVSALHPELYVPNEELVATNTVGNVFLNTEFIKRLEEKKTDSLVMTGVLYDACFSASVKGALKAGFNVLACLDATDCLPERLPEFALMLREGLTDIERQKLKCTTTDTVLGIFS